MNELQGTLFIIFKEFKKLCKTIGVKYCAAGGTLLGAVRHDGFIPWDDDMDFYMLREDYERFKKEAPKYVSSDYLVQTNETDPEWLLPFIKIRKNNTTMIESGYEKERFHQGAWIDIFPVDEYIFDKELLVKTEKKRKELLRRIRIKYHIKSKLKGKIYNVLILIKHPSYKKAYQQLVDLVQQFNGDPKATHLGMSFSDLAKGRELFPKELLSDFETHKFEDDEIIIPKRFDEILTIQYGDWRKLPPEEDRLTGSGHSVALIDLNKSYKYYLDLKSK